MNEVRKEFSKFSPKHLALLGAALDAVSKVKVGIGNAQTVINQAFQKVGFEPKFQKMISKSLNTLDRYGAGFNSLTISSSIHQNVIETKALIKKEIGIALIKKKSWDTVSRNLYKAFVAGELTESMLPGYIQQLVNAARRLDVSPMAYRRALRKTIDNISHLTNDTRLKKAYQSLIDATLGQSQKAVQTVIVRSIKAKVAYNGERIAITEMAKVYHANQFKHFQESETITAWRSVLSSAHKIFDVCDYHASADQFGLGPGVFPKNMAPNYPYHPRCTCSIVEVYKQIPKPQFDPKAGQKYFKANPKAEKLLLKRDQGKATKAPEKLIPNYTKASKVY